MLPPPPRTAKVVRLVELEPEVIHALAVGDLAAASTTSGLSMPSSFVDPPARSVWRLRSAQVVVDPSSRPWVIGAVVDVVDGTVVGRAGFHGPPDAAGTVEVGHAVDPAHRRRGCARAALLVLLDRAARHPDVRTVRASVSPANAASLALVEQHGFVRVGEQVDVEDGRELVLEVAAGAS